MRVTERERERERKIYKWRNREIKVCVYNDKEGSNWSINLNSS